MDELKNALLMLDGLCQALIAKEDWENSRVAEKLKLHLEKYVMAEENKMQAGEI